MLIKETAKEEVFGDECRSEIQGNVFLGEGTEFGAVVDSSRLCLLPTMESRNTREYLYICIRCMERFKFYLLGGLYHKCAAPFRLQKVKSPTQHRKHTRAWGPKATSYFAHLTLSVQ